MGNDEPGRAGVYYRGAATIMAPEAGQHVGSYELIEPLGSGGMGDVFRARDTRLGRLVAIKFVSRSLQNSADADARLEREARLASSLNHPGIVSVFDVGRHGNGPYSGSWSSWTGNRSAPTSRRAGCAHGRPSILPCKSRTRWLLRTMPESCIVTSSRRTSWSLPTGASRSSISG